MDLPRLPAELQHHVITLLDSPTDVVRCALVSRSWLSSSRATTFPAFAEVHNTKENFIELLKHPLSTLPKYLSRLSVTLSKSAPGYERALNGLIEHNVSIKELKINFARIVTKGAHLRLIGFITRMSHSLRKAEINACPATSVGSLLQEISHLNRLTELILVISPLHTNGSVLPEPLTVSAPPSLQFVHTNYMDISFLEKWALAARHVSFQPLTVEGIVPLRDLLSRPGIENVCRWDMDLNICFSIRAGNVIQSILQSTFGAARLSSLSQHLFFNDTSAVNMDFSNCVNLRSLSLTIILLPALTDIAPIAAIFRCLSTIPQQRVPGLTLYVSLAVGTKDDAQLDDMIDSYVAGVLNVDHITVALKYRRKERDYPKCFARMQTTRNFTLDLSR